MKNLVIVESLAKAKTIEKYLNSSKVLKSFGSFKVVPSFGHVDNLPAKELGIDVDNAFSIKYQILPDKAKVVDDLKKKAKDADMVWIASDADYEGEKIADSIRTILKLKKYQRVTFTEITQRALEASLQNPRQINELVVDAQETRRVLDRLVGYKLSPLLWKKYSTPGGALGLSAGRVQSAVMHAIIERESAITAFSSETYWYFIGIFNIGKTKVEDVKLYKDGKIYKTHDKDTSRSLLANLKNAFLVTDSKSKISRQGPDAPFVTSSFQQEAYTKLGMGMKKSMQIAQDLYENGHITYMRTDSTIISDDFKEDVRVFVTATYGEQYWDGEIRKKNAKNAQEAHEAIRPTVIDTETLENLSSDHKRVYDLIRKRTLAALMKHAVYDELDITIIDENNKEFVKNGLSFLANFKKLKFDGFLRVYGVTVEKYDFDTLKRDMNNIRCAEIRAKNTWSNPPQRFNDASLVKMMESEGIGRPSTYSGIIQKLTDKSYVRKTDIQGESKQTNTFVWTPSSKQIQVEKGSVEIGAEKSRMVPSPRGTEVDSYISHNFTYIVDKNFTSNMESDLDKIAEGKYQKQTILNTFWKQLSKDINIAGGEIKAMPQKQKLDSEIIEVTVSGVVYKIRQAKYGPVIEYASGDAKKFIGLSQYLKYTKKDFTNIDKDDVKFMLMFPVRVNGVKGENAEIEMGPYGLYLKNYGIKTNATLPNNKSKPSNHKIPYKMAMSFIESRGKETISAKDITRALEYVPISTHVKDKK